MPNEYWPKDSDNTIYQMSGTTTLQDLLLKAVLKWPGISLDCIEISAEHIQTKCLGYDLYDPGDYTDFIVLSKTGE